MNPLSCLSIKKAGRPSAGFTLVEVLIVTVILGCVAGGLGVTFLSGMRLWDHIRQSGVPRAVFFLDIELLAREIRQAVAVPEAGFEGGARQVAFPVVKDGELVKVSYLFEPESGRLVRKAERLADIRAGQNAAAEKEVLKAGDLSFEYLGAAGDGAGWQAAWTKDKGLCRAVCLRGTYQDEPFTKVIFIPAG